MGLDPSARSLQEYEPPSHLVSARTGWMDVAQHAEGD